MIFAIIGSRNFTDYKLLCKVCDKHLHRMTGIVSGGARGADALAERYARDHNIPITVYPAQWDVYGRSAGYHRNKLIVADADVMIAFPIGESRGTWMSIKLASIKEIEIIIEEQ